MKSQMWWYTARAGGIVAWGLSAISVVWGLLLSSRVLGRRITGPKLLDLHRFLGGLAVVFTGVHIFGLVLDSTVHFGPLEVLVPFASDWDPGAVAWGVIAFYILVAVEATSLLRRHVGERVWRMVHYGGFAVFLFGTIHGLKAGTDVENALIWWPAAGASAAVVGLVAARVFANGDPVPKAKAIDSIAVDRPGAELLERTLEGLRHLDETQSPSLVITVETIEVTAEVITPPPAPLSPRMAVSGSLFPSTDEVRADPGALDLTVPTGPDDRDGYGPPPAPPRPPWVADRVMKASADPIPEPPQTVLMPTVESRLPTAVPVGAPSQTTPIGPAIEDAVADARARRVRTPRRLSRTTVAATSLDSWRPERAEKGSLSAPPPPAEVDPTTGEPDPQAYRKWLREWLVYVESHA